MQAPMGSVERETGRRGDSPKDQEERVLECAERLARRRSLFLASMGHTLRSPLNGVLGFSEMLLDDNAGPLNERQRRYVERIAESGRRQLELIDNLVRLARLHAGQVVLQPEACSIAEIIEDAVSPYRTLAKCKGVNIVTEVSDFPGTLTVDPDHMTTAIRSLVSNAVRYTDRGGEVKVGARRRRAGSENGSAPDNGNRKGSCRSGLAEVLRIDVVDDGTGINPEDQKLIFDDIEDHRSLLPRRQRRTGTGLPLARRLVQLHGGRISASSSGVRGEGSTFSIELPLQADLGKQK